MITASPASPVYEFTQGNVIERGRSSPYSLYNEALVSMDVEGGFNPEISTGFIQTLSTRIKVRLASQRGWLSTVRKALRGGRGGIGATPAASPHRMHALRELR
jgi:hypothetical protein